MQPRLPKAVRPPRLRPRTLLRGVVVGFLLTPFWPAGCGAPTPTDPQVATTPATLQAPEKAPVSFLPHPAFAYADGSARVSIADIAERVTRSVVSVASERVMKAPERQLPFPFFFQPPMGPERREGLGSGVIVSTDGIVLTNNHVIEGASAIRVALADGREVPAELIGADDKSDLAVLRIQGKVEGLEPLEFGDSSRLRLGDVVLAIGNPFGVGQTVTMGIVSAKGRSDVGIEDYEDFIQTDAAINPGNSGGALVDMQGKLIGINTAILSRSGGYQGIGFAIPSDMARPIMESLVAHGKVVRGYLGVGIQDIDQNLQSALGLDSRDGVLISSVEPGGAADQAGIQRGDVVIAVDGVKVRTTGHLRNLIAAKGTERVELELLRNGKKLAIEANLNALPEEAKVGSQKLEKESGGIGLQLTPLTPDLAQRLGSRATQGVLVSGVAPGSPAAQAGISRGDILLEVGKKAVSNPGDVQKAIQAKKEGPLLFLVERKGRTLYLAVER